MKKAWLGTAIGEKGTQEQAMEAEKHLLALWAVTQSSSEQWKYCRGAGADWKVLI